MFLIIIHDFVALCAPKVETKKLASLKWMQFLTLNCCHRLLKIIIYNNNDHIYILKIKECYLTPIKAYVQHHKLNEVNEVSSRMSYFLHVVNFWTCRALIPLRKYVSWDPRSLNHISSPVMSCGDPAELWPLPLLGLNPGLLVHWWR